MKIQMFTGALVAMALLAPIGRVASQAPVTAAVAASDTDEHRIAELVLANHILAAQGVVDGFGHISVRSIKNPRHFFMSVSRPPALVTAGDIIEFDENSQPISPERRDLYSERLIHGEIFKARPDVQSVVHSHSPAVLPFGLTNTPLKALIHVGAFLGAEPAPVFDLRSVDGDNNKMLITRPETGAALAKTLGQRAVVLIRGHGMAVVGPSIQDAVFRAVYTQVNAQVEAEALRIGTPVFMNQFEIDRTDRIDRQWEVWARAEAAR